MKIFQLELLGRCTRHSASDLEGFNWNTTIEKKERKSFDIHKWLLNQFLIIEKYT
jgi:hypothetical protein